MNLSREGQERVSLAVVKYLAYRLTSVGFCIEEKEAVFTRDGLMFKDVLLKHQSEDIAIGLVHTRLFDNIPYISIRVDIPGIPPGNETVDVTCESHAEVVKHINTVLTDMLDVMRVYVMAVNSGFTKKINAEVIKDIIITIQKIW